MPNSTVKFITSLGDIEIEVFEDKTPITAANFLDYVKSGFYDGTIFHRVIPGFVAQGGGFVPGMDQKRTRAPIANEAATAPANARGTLSMARTMDPNSATAQFFINVKDNAFLDAAQSQDGNGYAVFGKVVQGMDVVDKIRKVPTGQKGMHCDVPLQAIIIKQATLEK